MTTTREEELQEYFAQLSAAEQSSVLQLMKTMVAEKTQGAARISLEQYNREIEAALANIERGEVYSQEEVEKMAKDW